jgi:tetratricopeptide (TPR) repeat protein
MIFFLSRLSVKKIVNFFTVNAFLGALCALVVQFALPGFSYSQTVTSAAGLVSPLSALGASARADAMGDAFTGLADDSSALFFNSAGLSGLSNARISLNHNSYLGGTFEETLLVGLPGGDLGGFAGALQYVFWGALDQRDAFGVDQGTYDDNDIALSLGWGREWSKGFSIGAAITGTQQKIVDSLYASLSGQVGLLWMPVENLRLGLVYSGFGTPVSGQALASDLKMGTSGLLRWDRDKTLRLALSGSYEAQGVSRIQGGLEAGFQKNLFLRLGYQLPLSDNEVTGFTNFSAGAGIRLNSITLDYAYVPYGELGTSHRVSLAYDFPNPTPVAAKPVTVFVMPSPTPTPLMTPVPAKPSVEVQFEVPLSATTPVSDQETSALIDQYEKATQTAPQDAQAWHQLGLAYWKAGKKGLAVQCLEQALRLNPDDQALKKWLEDYRAKHPDKP